jgi:hypothetical protein
LNREECAPYIDVDQRVKMFFGDFTEGNEFADAGVGEDNIDSSLQFADCLVEKIKIGHSGDVSLNTRRIGTDRLHGLVEFLRRRPVMKT